MNHYNYTDDKPIIDKIEYIYNKYDELTCEG